jgi:hypothetical protein
MILERQDVPYGDLTRDVFDETPSQQVIPFVGAGVSISQKYGPAAAADRHPPDSRIRRALEVLTGADSEHADPAAPSPPALDPTTLLFAEVALEVAFVIQQMRDAGSAVTDDRILDRLRDDRYPPSASELSEWLSWKAAYASFDDIPARVAGRLSRSVDESYRTAMLDLLRALATLAGVSPAPLALVSAYFEEVRRRRTLLDDLGDILANKTTPTRTHELVARAAGWHLGERQRKDGRKVDDGIGHYLIVTTNYDCLMEHALDVPYVVLSMSHTDYLVRPRFGNMPAPLIAAFERANPPRRPRLFSLEPPTPGSDPDAALQPPRALAVVYKVHGCIQEWRTADSSKQHDTIVISDKDYVVNISRLSDNDGVIPACVSDILSGTGTTKPYLLFLGYSLRDWNVRGMLRAIRAKRAGAGNEDDDYGDYTVIRSFGKIDEAFFLQNKIRIIHEDLTYFSDRVFELAQRTYVV